MPEFSLSVSLIVFPFTFVDGPAFESVGFSEFSNAVMFGDPLNDLISVPVIEVVGVSDGFRGNLILLAVGFSRNYSL